MGYGAAGLGYGAAQAFGGMGEALDRVLSRRDQRDQYEQGLKMDAEERQYRRGRDSAADAFRQEGVQRAAEVQEAANARHEAERAQNRMNELTDRFAEVQASGEFPDAQFIPGVAGPSRIDYGERAPYEQTPEGQKSRYFMDQGLTGTGNNRQTQRPPPGPNPVNWQTMEDPPRSGNLVQVNPQTGERRPLRDEGMSPGFPQRTGNGMGSSEFYGRGQGGGGPAPFDPNAQAFGNDPRAMIDEERRRRGG